MRARAVTSMGGGDDDDIITKCDALRAFYCKRHADVSVYKILFILAVIGTLNFVCVCVPTLNKARIIFNAVCAVFVSFV